MIAQGVLSGSPSERKNELRYRNSNSRRRGTVMRARERENNLKYAECSYLFEIST